jgi:hypothetical protein
MRKTYDCSCLGCGKLTTTTGLSRHVCFGVRGYDDIRGYWTRKRYSSKYRKIPFNLSGAEMIELFELAGITPADITNKDPNGYNLCRVGDEGPYEMGNCYFATHSDNGKRVI